MDALKSVLNNLAKQIARNPDPALVDAFGRLVEKSVDQQTINGLKADIELLKKKQQILDDSQFNMDKWMRETSTRMGLDNPDGPTNPF